MPSDFACVATRVWFVGEPSRASRDQPSLALDVGRGVHRDATCDAPGSAFSYSLLDLRRPAFTHGHAYVAVSRVHTASELGAFVNDACSVSYSDGSRSAVLASVTYPELLMPRASALTRAVAPAPAAPSAPAIACTGARGRARLAQLIPHMDESTDAQRMRKRPAHAHAQAPKRART